jgi:hypothetical protein
MRLKCVVIHFTSQARNLERFLVLPAPMPNPLHALAHTVSRPPPMHSSSSSASTPWHGFRLHLRVSPHHTKLAVLCCIRVAFSSCPDPIHGHSPLAAHYDSALPHPASLLPTLFAVTTPFPAPRRGSPLSELSFANPVQNKPTEPPPPSPSQKSFINLHI